MCGSNCSAEVYFSAELLELVKPVGVQPKGKNMAAEACQGRRDAGGGRSEQRCTGSFGKYEAQPC